MKRLMGLILAAACLFGASTTLGYVPNTTTVVVNYTIKVKRLHLANTSAGEVTVTLADRSTNCAAGPCQFWPVITMAANSVYVTDLAGLKATSGFTWVASSANAVVGWVEYD